MSKIFDNDENDDSDADLVGKWKTDNEYAKNYDNWRKKEEINKFKTKYGEDVDFDEDSSSSSEDDEDGIELTDQVEKNFFKTLACLKNKDPRIYNDKVRFFDDSKEANTRKKESAKKEKPVFLKDYERNLILEKGGKLSDEEDEDENNRPRSPTYVEEQNRLKESFKKALERVDETEDNEEDNNWGGLFKERVRTKEEKEKDESEYRKWLAGKRAKLDNDNIEQDLKPLRDYWNKPDLDEGEKFLRDYILNKKFLDKEDEEYIPTYDEIVHDSDENDEETVEKQEEFEHKFNFRYEEPDQEFIKRYPRIMENSVRKKDDRRKLKREETKERKKKEKEEKMRDLRKLQELKRKEIEEKLEKLKEITGNDDLGFDNEDLDGDFDPEAHDRKMQELFNDDYYQGPEGDAKPEFPDLDQELEIESWERYEGEKEVGNGEHCEDENFNMDCDYNPQSSKNLQDELIESSRSKKRRKRKSKFAEAVSAPKPKFDPNDKNYEQYFEEYYKLDCEDIIGDLPCRFKYRKVVPNDFGLSIEEILLAKERELNKWCSLKKAVQIRPDDVEKYEQIAYKRKGQNVNLKKKILPSLFVDENKPEDAPEKEDDAKENVENSKKNDINKKNMEKSENKDGNSRNVAENDGTEMIIEKCKDKVKDDKEAENKTESNQNNSEVKKSKSKKKKKKNKQIQNNEISSSGEKSEVKLDNIGISQNAVVKKTKKKRNNSAVNSLNNENNDKHNKSRKRKNSNSISQNKDEEKLEKKKFKPNKNKNRRNKESALSDARLAAYGLNPKKYKNKLKYGKSNK